jgi:adenylosuccinate synthase
MPVSIIVGGQYGSEGKGKVSLEVAREHGPDIIAMRVGGPNSGHIAYDKHGVKRVFRQIPVCAADGTSQVVIPAGSYLDVPLLLKEAEELGLSRETLAIDPEARIITDCHRQWEIDHELSRNIGSTASGTGAAVLARIWPGYDDLPDLRAKDDPGLKPYIQETLPLLRKALDAEARVIVEGTQGFGLSLHHGPWPKVTSRDTTAASVLAECGLSPFDVDDVTLVLRCHPIRVAGNSGPLPGEKDWAQIARESGSNQDLIEYTTVTQKVRRIGEFNAALVRQAIAVNSPTRIVLNHLDYIDWDVRTGNLTEKARQFVEHVEMEIGRRIDWLGVNEQNFIKR